MNIQVKAKTSVAADKPRAIADSDVQRHILTCARHALYDVLITGKITRWIYDHLWESLDDITDVPWGDDWQLSTQNGKLLKRIERWLYKASGQKISDYYRDKIASLISRAASSSVAAYDITDTFDWNAGDYGDRGSCYWAARYQARTTLVHNGAFAIRLYDAAGNGIGRAWLHQTRHGIVMFNPYGANVQSFLDILSVVFVCEPEEVTLHNHGDTSGLVWINSDRGWLFHPDGAQVDRVDLRMELVARCSECGELFDPDYGDPDAENHSEYARCADCSPEPEPDYDEQYNWCNCEMCRRERCRQWAWEHGYSLSRFLDRKDAGWHNLTPDELDHIEDYM